MAALSMDLRKRIIDADRSLSSREVGRRFCVSDSVVRKLRLRYDRTGSYEARATGHRQRLLDEKAEERVAGWMRKAPDLTIVEVRDRYAKVFKIFVSEPTMRRLLNRLGFTRKKKPWCLKNNSAKSTKRSEEHT